MRLSSPKLLQAMSRQLKECLSVLTDAPSAVRTELLSMTSTLRYLSVELEHAPEYAETCDSSAKLLKARLQTVGLDTPIDVPSILADISSPSFPADAGNQIFAWLVEYLQSCNQAELGMYRRGLRQQGGKP